VDPSTTKLFRGSFGLLPPSNPLFESVFKLDKACSILTTERSGSLYAQFDRVSTFRMIVQKFEHIFGSLDMSPCTFLDVSCAAPEELSF
jgi:hypothetical protein